jgi:antitoxin VapB
MSSDILWYISSGVAMSEKTAKLFPNGRSQAVRLPATYRFEGDEVYIRRDAETGEVILSPVPNSWDGFFALREAAAAEAVDFLVQRNDGPPQPRTFFERKRKPRK